ncbi:uncharacterized protein ColSpa_09541 [Colletotrichum spaethianum]|uniref:Uncharacterized protein n=1 Tax=Colletotrichum spaethianum TaxID=700344 RepID=A0AA37PBY5_9PEZI|nr:uncharacterized protein ColSpa_09541 [Colletotrichum spaethianum]GKT49360.1 hypothetical protein ColSpa_09541 [Colletotrichum spaethianum]
MQKVSMIPLISFDAVVNIYLTILFLIPLKSLYTFKHFPKTPANIRLRTVALRTFIGALCTLTSSIVNLTVLMVLNGEPGWVCLMCCNSDILFSAIVVQWVTNKDNVATQCSSGGGSRNEPFIEDFRRTTGTGYSPHIAPSQKHVMDDIAEISLDSSTRSITVNSSKTSSEAERACRTFSAGSVPGSGAVVTTTTKRESKPTTAGFEEMSIEDGCTGQNEPRRTSGRETESGRYTRDT